MIFKSTHTKAVRHLATVTHKWEKGKTLLCISAH